MPFKSSKEKMRRQSISMRGNELNYSTSDRPKSLGKQDLHSAESSRSEIACQQEEYVASFKASFRDAMGNSPNLLMHLMLMQSEKSSPQKEHSDLEDLGQVHSDS